MYHIRCTKIFFSLLFLFFLFPLYGRAFSLYKFDTAKEGPILLITAGIHGDEPAAFSAAGLLISHYTFKSGRVWIIPNVNFKSILLSSRGIAGDMNRKFLSTNKDDPDYADVQRLKELITQNTVFFVHSMHDGYGFYREKFYSEKFAPQRWGQSIVIDQEVIPHDIPYANTLSIANTIAEHINKNLINEQDTYRVKNTRTAEGNVSMEQSLTWFSVQNKVPSIGIEASKSIPLSHGTFYHLLALESVFGLFEIDFDRKFELTPEGVKNALQDIQITLFNTYTLPIKNLRKEIKYLPFASADLEFTTTNPLLYLYRKKNAYALQYGNNVIATIHPAFFPFQPDKKELAMTIDGVTKTISMGSLVRVTKSFSVPEIPSYRLNIIGYVNKENTNEFTFTVRKADMQKQFSIDTQGTIYRVELYKGDAFVGMVLVQFAS